MGGGHVPPVNQGDHRIMGCGSWPRIMGVARGVGTWGANSPTHEARIMG